MRTISLIRIPRARSRIPHSASPGRERGYSLTEILAVVAFTAVISSIAVPNLVTLSTEYQLVSTANQIGFDISRTRMKAVGENIFCRIRASTTAGSHRYWIERSDNGVDYAMVGTPTYLPKGISFRIIPPQLPSFNRMGIGTTSTAITVENRIGQAKTVSVNVLGRVSVQ